MPPLSTISVSSAAASATMLTSYQCGSPNR
jgi:hypothetical protein